MEKQTTLHTPITLAGQGLHTGQQVHVTLKPADADTGFTLRRVDLNPVVEFQALATLVSDTSRGTTLSSGNARICTIEHLLSALHGLGVDNVVIEVSGEEVPILDGSARPWVEAIQKAGIDTLDAPRRYYEIQERIEFSIPETGASYIAEPYDGIAIDSTIEFKSQVIGRQQHSINGFSNYSTEIAPCRTFVFLHEIAPLLAMNLIKGGALDNALVFVDHPLIPEQMEHLSKVYGKDPNSFKVNNGVLNTIEPYFPNEPARHKLLDFIGDIMLTGCRIKGRFTISCPGHKSNVIFAQHLMQRMTQHK